MIDSSTSYDIQLKRDAQFDVDSNGNIEKFADASGLFFIILFRLSVPLVDPDSEWQKMR